MIHPRRLLPFVVALLFVAMACTSDGDTEATTATASASLGSEGTSTAVDPTATAVATPTITSVAAMPTPAAFYPDGTGIGFDAVDPVIDEVIAMDVRALANRVVLRAEPCVTVPGQSEAPPWLCPEGVDQGTLVERFDIGACGGDLGLGSEVERYVEALFDPAHQGYIPSPQSAQPLHLYAVTIEIDGEYTAFFVYGADSVFRRLRIDEKGRITSIGYGCGDPAVLSLPRDRPFVLPPPAVRAASPVRAMSGPLPVWVMPGTTVSASTRCIDMIEALVPLSLSEKVEAEAARCEVGMAEFLRLRLVADESGVAYLDSVQFTVLRRNPPPSVSRDCVEGRAALLPEDGSPEDSLTGNCTLEASLLHEVGETIRAWMPLPAGPDLPTDPRCHELLPLLGDSSESPHDRYVLCRVTP